MTRYEKRFNKYIGNNKMDTSSQEGVEEIEKLLNICIDILNSWEKYNIVNSRRNPPRVFLEAYRKTLATTCLADHQDYYFNLYKTHRTIILSGEDTWLNKKSDGTDVELWWGYNIPNVRAHNMRLLLSTFYLRALDLRDKVIKNNISQDQSYLDNDEYHYIDELVHQLLVIFRLCIRETEHVADNKILSSIIDEIAYDIGIGDNVVSQPPVVNGFQDILSTLPKIMQSSGLGEQLQLDPNKASEAFNSILGNKEFIDGFVGNMNKTINNISGIQNNGGSVDISKVFSEMMSVMSPAIKTITESMKVDPPPGVVDTTPKEKKTAQAEAVADVAGKVVERIGDVVHR